MNNKNIHPRIQKRIEGLQRNCENSARSVSISSEAVQEIAGLNPDKDFPFIRTISEICRCHGIGMCGSKNKQILVSTKE